MSANSLRHNGLPRATRPLLPRSPVRPTSRPVRSTLSGSLLVCESRTAEGATITEAIYLDTPHGRARAATWLGAQRLRLRPYRDAYAGLAVDAVALVPGSTGRPVRWVLRVLPVPHDPTGVATAHYQHLAESAQGR